MYVLQTHSAVHLLTLVVTNVCICVSAQGIFEHVLESQVVDNETLKEFCKMNCSGRVWELTRKLITDCEYIPQPVS